MIYAIIQARMGSKRLPGKVMINIQGKPVLQLVVERVTQSNLINKVIIATSIESMNDNIRNFCVENNILVYSGSEDNVLDRFYQAAKINMVKQDDIIVRITADCPLIDPEIIDKVIEEFQNKNADYAANVINPTFPDGLDCEALRFSTLIKVWENALLTSEREHVTLYIRNHPELFNIVSIENNMDLSKLRWTLDEKEDLDLISSIYKNLYSINPFFRLKDILNLLEEKPELNHINSKYVRNEGLLKSLEIDTKNLGD